MWNQVCCLDDLNVNSGVGALVNHEQIAIFYLPETEQKVFVVENWDPLGKAFVISRGIVGDINGKAVVASPLYKQHFVLCNGECIEEPEVTLKTWPVEIRENQIWVDT